MRKHDVKNIHLQIYEVKPFVNEKYNGFTINWSSDIGWGEYTVYQDDGKWYGDSECMDVDDNKEFITELMRLFVEQLHIEG